MQEEAVREKDICQTGEEGQMQIHQVELPDDLVGLNGGRKEHEFSYLDMKVLHTR
jgi:hypothetical protein